jgi:electron transfer flavoprotein alpha/beta subunit
MIEAILTIAAAVIPLIITAVMDRHQPREAGYDAKIKAFDKDLAVGNADGLSAAFERMRAPSERPGGPARRSTDHTNG